MCAMSTFATGLIFHSHILYPLDALERSNVVLKEIVSNLTVASIFIPIAADLALSIGQNPLLLMVPIAISASMAFMFPISTAPNAIVFGTGKFSILAMSLPGIFFNSAGILIITIFSFLVGIPIFDIQLGVVPSWATAASNSTASGS